MGKPCVLLFYLALMVVAWASKDNFSNIDKLRNDLLEMRDSSGNHRAGRRAGDDTYMSLIQAYDEFGTKMDEQSPSTGNRHFNSLNSLWLWARIQSEMRSVNGLYSRFREKLHQAVMDGQVINIQDWVDFADIILNDPNFAVPVTLERVSDVIIKQNLFIAAYEEV